MADQTETVTEAASVTDAKPEPQAAKGKTLDEMQAEIDRMQKALKEANKEAADRRKKLDEFEKAEQARKDAELSEQERLKKEVETLRAQATEAQRALQQRTIAEEVGLPAVFAARIVGADRD